jgi:hypothetical protein
VSIPFAYSTAGYGILFNMPGYGSVSVGESGGMVWHAELFSETCDERALPLVGSRSESVWKGGSRGGVAGGWNAACQSLVTWYIPGQTVQTAASQALTEPLKASTYSQPLRLDAA